MCSNKQKWITTEQTPLQLRKRSLLIRAIKMQFKALAKAHTWTCSYRYVVKKMALFICGKPVGGHVLVAALVSLVFGCGASPDEVRIQVGERKPCRSSSLQVTSECHPV